MTNAGFERDQWLICKIVPEKRHVAGVLGWYNGVRVVSIRCESQACRHIYDSNGRSTDAVHFHLWDVQTGECVHTEHMLRQSPRHHEASKGMNHG